MDLKASDRRVLASKGPVRRSALALLCGGGIGTVWLLLASSASAQVQSPGLGSGPAVPTDLAQLMLIDVRTEVTYDSNVARGQAIVSDVKDLRPDDVITSPSVAANIVKPIGPLAVFLNGTGGYEFYERNKNLESARVNALAGASGKFGACTASLSGGYGVRQSDQADLPLETVRNIQTTVTGSVQTSCAIGRSLFGNASFVESTLDNSGSIGVVDSRTSGVNVGLGFRNKLIGDIGVQFGYQNVDYTSPGILGVTQPGFRDYTLGLSFSRPIGRRLNGDATLSISQVEPEGPGASSETTWSGHGGLRYQVNPRLSLDLGYTRAAFPTTQEGFGYSLDESFNLGASYRLSSRLDIAGGGGWSTTHNINPTPVVLLTAISNETSKNLYGTATLHLLHKVSLALKVNYSDRNTNLTVFNYSDYRVALSIAKSF